MTISKTNGGLSARPRFASVRTGLALVATFTAFTSAANAQVEAEGGASASFGLEPDDAARAEAAQEAPAEPAVAEAEKPEAEAAAEPVEAAPEEVAEEPAEQPATLPEEETVKAEPTGVPAYAGVRATRKPLSRRQRYASVPYMERYLPEANMWEVGMFTGLLFPSANHNLKVQALPREGYSSVAGELGGRLGYYPFSFVGAEIEGMAAGGSTEVSNYSAVFYSLRAHALLQLPIWSVTPFLLVGGGAIGAVSETLGHDRDPAFHWGLGVKVPVTHRVSGRFDFRDTVAQKGESPQGVMTHHMELQLGVSFVFERSEPKPISDVDYDGLYDSEDKCPHEGALTVDGCPADTDGDGIYDHKDECPWEAGTLPNGCPDRDQDGDGVPVPADQCPEEPGPAPSGCPDLDEDSDGILGAADKCPTKPENRNGFEDEDGCPDEMPAAITRFTGVIQGINFKQGTAEIEESSKPTLDSAVEILLQYPSVRLEVSGHTSSEGSEERNQELSVQRAESVKGVFMSKGVADDRVVARGAGASEPIADNGTKEGRQQNRRIEFRVLSQK